MRRLADALTLIRLVCSPALSELPPDGAAFWMLYAALGLTDALDGPFARASRQGPTERGARLDSAADAVFFAALLAALLRLCTYPVWMLVWAGLIAAARVLALVLRLRKGNATPPHTRWDKAAGVALFAAPVLVYFAGAWGILPALATASLAAGSQFAVRRGERSCRM